MTTAAEKGITSLSRLRRAYGRDLSDCARTIMRQTWQYKDRNKQFPVAAGDEGALHSADSYVPDNSEEGRPVVDQLIEEESITKHRDCLTEQEQDVIDRRVFWPIKMTIHETAADLGLTEDRIKYLQETAFKKLRWKMASG